jgi:hypothetical protein
VTKTLVCGLADLANPAYWRVRQDLCNLTTSQPAVPLCWWVSMISATGHKRCPKPLVRVSASYWCATARRLGMQAPAQSVSAVAWTSPWTT